MKSPKLASLSCETLTRGELPADPGNCELLFTATIGLDGTRGDNFQFVVVTPAALVDSQYRGWCKGHMLLQAFSWELVDNFLANLLASIQGDSWEQIATQLHQYMDWEFYGYVEST